MKVKKMIEHLNKMNPEAEIFIECDHGQKPSQPCAPNEGFYNPEETGWDMQIYFEDAMADYLEGDEDFTFEGMKPAIHIWAD